MDTNTSSNYSVMTVRMSFKKENSKWDGHAELASVHFHINSTAISCQAPAHIRAISQQRAAENKDGR